MINHDNYMKSQNLHMNRFLVFHWTRFERLKSHKMSLPYEDLLWRSTFCVLCIYKNIHR